MDLTKADPDFVRLMQGEVKLNDFTDQRQQELREYARYQFEIYDLDALIATIPDPQLRATMQRWNSYFS